MKSFCIILLLVSTKFLISQNIVFYTDSIFTGDTLELHVTSPVPINNPIPGNCGVLHSVYDSTWSNKLTVDLTFDWSGPRLGTCVRRDTIRMAVNTNSGIYNLICFGSVIDNSVPPGIFYSRTVSDTVQIVVLNSTGIAKAAMENVTISPNPAQAFFTIGGLQNEVNQIELFSLSGQKVREFDAKETHHSLVGLENGIYLLRIYSNEAVVSRKLVVSR